MGVDLDIFPLDQQQTLPNFMQNQNFQNLHQQNRYYSLNSWMWNSKQEREDDDSWEVRAFEEDINTIMGATWPPRSYTCTFCRREFRSAQALGGHMNVHRKDRAKLHQKQHGTSPIINPNSSILTASPSSSSPAFTIPPQEFGPNGGLCFLYQSPNPSRISTAPSSFIASGTNLSPSTCFSISPYSCQNLVAKDLDFSMAQPRQPPVADHLLQNCYNYKSNELEGIGKIKRNMCCEKDLLNEELDLELRLGQAPASSPSSSSS